jgi:hypothetical protein
MWRDMRNQYKILVEGIEGTMQAQMCELTSYFAAFYFITFVSICTINETPLEKYKSSKT